MKLLRCAGIYLAHQDGTVIKWFNRWSLQARQIVDAMRCTAQTKPACAVDVYRLMMLIPDNDKYDAVGLGR